MFFLKMLLLLYWLPCTKTGFLYSIWYSTFFDGIHCFVSVLLIVKDQVTCRIIIKNFFFTANQYSKNNSFHAALKIPVPAPWLFNADDPPDLTKSKNVQISLA